MSLRLEIKKKMLERSPRVKAIDFHLTNSWVVFGLYSGTLALHDYQNNVLVSSNRPASALLRHRLSQSEQSNF
jgi:coatomer subunit beta'